MDPRRSERLSQAIREELEEMISYEMGDPRIDVQGVSEVLVSSDGRQARVLLILTSDAKKQQLTIEALNNARGYLRVELGHRLDIFRIPELHFEAAIGAELGPRVAHLLKRVRKGRPRADEPPEKKPVS
jgi:ribosome-binding factor A